MSNKQSLKQVSIFMDAEQWQRIRRMAFERGVSASAIVRGAVDYALEPPQKAAPPRGDGKR